MLKHRRIGEPRRSDLHSRSRWPNATSGTGNELAIGKDIRWAPQGSIALKGFPDPVTIYAVDWQTG